MARELVGWVGIAALAIAAAACGSVAPGAPATSTVASPSPTHGSTSDTALIHGRVTDTKGMPIADALFDFVGIDVPDTWAPTDEPVFTDAAGQYQIDLIPPNSSFEVTVRAEGYRSETRTVVVDATGIAEADFVLERE